MPINLTPEDIRKLLRRPEPRQRVDGLASGSPEGPAQSGSGASSGTSDTSSAGSSGADSSGSDEATSSSEAGGSDTESASTSECEGCATAGPAAAGSPERAQPGAPGGGQQAGAAAQMAAGPLQQASVRPRGFLRMAGLTCCYVAAALSLPAPPPHALAPRIAFMLPCPRNLQAGAAPGAMWQVVSWWA
jgi:hypothetical protein